MRPEIDLDTFDVEWAESPATKLELYMITRLLQNYTLLRVRELADVTLSEGEQRNEIAKRLAKLEADIDQTMVTLITRGQGDGE